MNLFKKYISKATRAKGEPRKQSMFLEYKGFIRWLSNQAVTVDEIRVRNPELLKEIHKAVEVMDSCFNKEDYRGFTEGIKRVKDLYLEAVHKNIERGNEQ